MIKNLIHLGAAISMIFFFTVPAGHADLKILVIPKGSKAIFWKNVGMGAHQAGKDLAISITYRGPYAEDRHSAQFQIIEYGIRQGYDAIVLAPNHVTKSAPVLKKAVAAGIKVVLIDSDMDVQYHATLVESDNHKAGQTAAVYMASLIGGAGEVVLARHIKNHASTHHREKAFIDTVTSNYPRIKVIADPYVGFSMGSAYHTISDLIDRFSTIDAIFSVSEEATLGILKALKERRLEGKIKFIGFDINTVISNAIINHEMDGTIAQNPFQIGYQGVKAAYQLVRNESVPKKIYTETTLITPENYQSDIVQDIITSNIPRHDSH